MLTPLAARNTAHLLILARRYLITKVVVSLRDEGQARYSKLEELQDKFEICIRELPIWLRSERFLSKHVVDPAQRELERHGVLESARRAKRWGL